MSALKWNNYLMSTNSCCKLILDTLLMWMNSFDAYTWSIQKLRKGYQGSYGIIDRYIVVKKIVENHVTACRLVNQWIMRMFWDHWLTIAMWLEKTCTGQMKHNKNKYAILINWKKQTFD